MRDAGGEGRVRGGGDVATAIGEARIGAELRRELDGEALRRVVDIDLPGGIARVIEQLRVEGIHAVAELADAAALMAEGGELQAVADRAVGEGCEQLVRGGRGDDLGQGLDGGDFVVALLHGPEYEAGFAEAAEVVDIG